MSALTPHIRWSVLIGLVCGTALWTTLGSLDSYVADSGITRVALLPSLSVLLVLVVVATAVCAGLYLSLTYVAGRQRPDETVIDPRLAGDNALRTLRPLAGSVLLVVPYLPWVADVIPALTVLAGPGSWLVWCVVVSETGYRIAVFLSGATWSPGFWTETRFMLAVALVGLLLSGGVAARLTGTALFPGGDEPHYLVMAQSLWRDGDLKIENNHAQRDYAEYYHRPVLAPHYRTRGVDGEIYSVHPVGLPLLLAPVYAVDGYRAVRVVLVAVTAAVGALLVLWIRRLGLSRASTIFGWLAIFLSAPFFFFSFAVYPEMLAGLMVVTAMLLLGTVPTRVHTAPRRYRALRWVVVGVAAGLLPWLHTKYAPMAAAVLLVALGRIWLYGRGGTRAERMVHSCAVVVPFGLILVGWFLLFFAFWGTSWPTAPYGGQPETDLLHLIVGAPGLVFDQEYGVLPYAPVFVMAVAGLLGMWRTGGDARRLSGEIVLVVVPLISSVGAHNMWWGGSAPPGRPVVSVLPLLGVPIAWQYARVQAKPVLATAARLLLFVGLGVTGLLALAQQGLLLANNRDGTSALLAHLSPGWSLTDAFPTFIADPPLVALGGVVVWFAVYWISARLITWCRRWNVPGTLPRVVIITGSAIVLSLVAPEVMLPGADQESMLDKRSRIGLLDRFDATWLPTAIIYDPARLTDAGEVPPLLTYAVRPPDEPVGLEPLLYGRRLSLPAGLYEIIVSLPDARAAAVSGELSLQLGRLGPPFARWDVVLSPRGVWSATVSFETDVGYVGFRATPELEQARPDIRLRPAVVTDAHHRPDTRPVVASLRSPSASFYFFDSNIHVEPAGFWTRRARSASFLVARSVRAERPARAVRLRARCGPVINTLQVKSGRWHKSVTLRPGERHDFEVPTPADRAQVDVTVTGGFVPAEVDASSHDTRDLGCRFEADGWIE